MVSVKNISNFLAGAAVGAVAALLLAPASGEETRGKIMKSKQGAEDSFSDMISEGRKSWNKLKGRAVDTVEVAQEEMDDFLTHLLGEGQKAWKRAKAAASDVAADVKSTAKETIENGKTAVKDAQKDGESYYNKNSPQKQYS